MCCFVAFSGGAEQLLVDSNHLESVVLALHWARPSDVTARGGLRAESVEGERRPASGSFGRLVKREMQRPKAVLSLLSAPAEELVGVVGRTADWWRAWAPAACRKAHGLPKLRWC